MLTLWIRHVEEWKNRIKNPHPEVEVFPKLDVDKVDISAAQYMFTDFYNISGTHGYQQVAVHTIF